jgi:hypothetical protein
VLAQPKEGYVNHQEEGVSKTYSNSGQSQCTLRDPRIPKIVGDATGDSNMMHKRLDHKGRLESPFPSLQDRVKPMNNKTQETYNVVGVGAVAILV